MRSFIALAVTAALAGRVVADDGPKPFQVNVTNTLFDAKGFVTAPDSSPLKAACVDPCNNATTAIDACSGDPKCLCDPKTTAPVTSCHQCFFADVIRRNAKPEPIFGNNVAFGQYGLACNASGIPNIKTALTTPDTWMGPRDIILNTPQTVVTVGFGAILGFGALYILSTI